LSFSLKMCPNNLIELFIGLSSITCF
jgi:hypothetical protein